MATFPISDVAIIAAVLGLFFLAMAFYKSIFHKRRPKTHHAAQAARTPAVPENQPVKLSDPFQQVSTGSAPPQHPQKTDNPFFPAYPGNGETTVSAFRQFVPSKGFDTAASQEPDSIYKWE
jgi:hypothetical protein